jgi:hypothetical protein
MGPMLTPEGRDKIRFFGTIFFAVISVISTIVISTTVVVGYKNEIRENQAQLADLKRHYTETAKQVSDLIQQREYGVSNKEWYLAKYGTAPASNLSAIPSLDQFLPPKPSPPPTQPPLRP